MHIVTFINPFVKWYIISVTSLSMDIPALPQ